MQKKVIILVAIIMLVSFAVYSFIPIYVAEPFFHISLTHPEAPIDEIRGGHYPFPGIFVRTPVRVDREGRIYILGRKGSKVQVVVVNKLGRIERIITPRWKDGRFLQWGFHISVSPSGNRFWTLEWDKAEWDRAKNFVHRVTVHDYEGKAIMDWIISGYGMDYWYLTAYSEDTAFALSPSTLFRFTVGRQRPDYLKIPRFFETCRLFFHDGKYVLIGDTGELSRYLGVHKTEGKTIKPDMKELQLSIIKWTPERGAQLVSKFKSSFGYPWNIQWIDERGNFYDRRHGHSTIRLSSFLTKIAVLDKIVRALGISNFHVLRVIESLVIFSQKGKLLAVISFPSIIRPKKGEKLEYGQLVKVDKTGIYLEVERVSEPREYRIVRIVKKRRWQVWWEWFLNVVKSTADSDKLGSQR